MTVWGTMVRCTTVLLVLMLGVIASASYLLLICSFAHLLSNTIREVLQKKNDKTWEFFPRCQTPPPPPQYGNAHVKNTVFFPEEIFFFRKIKHVLAPQDDFGMQKKLGKQTKKVGLGQTPPPSMGKIPP